MIFQGCCCNWAGHEVSRHYIQADWPGMRIIVGGETEETQKSMGSLVVAFAIAAVGIYLVLLLLFNSLTQPLVVMFAVPFGLIGVIFAFALHGEAIGFLAMLGVIGLVGIVVNDSLILVSLANRIRETETDVSATTAIARASSGWSPFTRSENSYAPTT